MMTFAVFFSDMTHVRCDYRGLAFVIKEFEAEVIYDNRVLHELTHYVQ